MSSEARAGVVDGCGTLIYNLPGLICGLQHVNRTLSCCAARTIESRTMINAPYLGKIGAKKLVKFATYKI